MLKSIFGFFPMKFHENLLKPQAKTVGMLGALLSVVSLFALALLPWDFLFEIPGKEVFTGEIQLNEGQLYTFQTQLTMILVVDFVFLIGWLLSWPVFCYWIKPKNTVIENREKVILILGLFGFLADCIENMFQIAMIKQIIGAGTVPEQVYILWQIILIFSYLMPYLAMLVFFSLSCQYLKISVQERWIGIIFTIIAYISKLIPPIQILGDIWFLFLFLYILYWFKRNVLEK
jgi:hypothetical protein